MATASSTWSAGGNEYGTRAHVHLGTSEGIEPTASTVLVGDPGFGYAAIGVGDVDGDGFGDLAVKGPNGLELFAGSPSGPLATSIWTGTVPENVGRKLTSGDVNGDGQLDLIAAGRSDFSGPGGLAVFLSGPTGFSTTPDFERPG
jgi:hypothetical protein